MKATPAAVYTAIIALITGVIIGYFVGVAAAPDTSLSNNQLSADLKTCREKYGDLYNENLALKKAR